MITIVAIDEEILDRAARVTGIREKTAVVRKSLESLIAWKSAKRLAALGGSEKGLNGVPRRGGETGESCGAGGGPDPCSEIHEGGAATDGGYIADGGGNGR